MITETKIRAGLLGAKLGHSFSPQIHAELADYPYDLVELTEAEIEPLLADASEKGEDISL